MKETFEDYLQRLKDRRTEDDYKYTDEDFDKYKDYISDCCKNGMSVYKCLEFMYFAEKDMDDQLFNRESKQECTITKIMQMDAKMAYDSLPKQETLEQIDQNNPVTRGSTALVKKETIEEVAEIITTTKFSWEQEKSYSEEEVLIILHKRDIYKWEEHQEILSLTQWFEQFKK